MIKKYNISIYSITLNLIFIFFIFATFYFQYEYLFVTRIITVVFAIVYLVIEIKKEYFSENKMLFIIFSVVSILALIIGIVFDNTTTNSVAIERVFLAPIFVFVLIRIMYNDLYDKNSN
jgi:hypothetical protein